MTTSAVKAFIVSAISAQANKTIAQAQQKYFKDVIRFRGLKAPTVDQIYKKLKQSEEMTKLKRDEHIELAFDLLTSEFAEDKRIGVSLLKEHITASSEFVKRVEGLFEKHVYDWGTCDSICGQVLHYCIIQDKTLAKPITAWRSDANIWKKRASCVAFIKLAKHGEHNELLFETAKECIQSPERFVQLGTGWLLRELSLADREGVVKFIKENYNHFSREGLRYAIEKMEVRLKNQLLGFGSSNEQQLKKKRGRKGTKRDRHEGDDKESELELDEDASERSSDRGKKPAPKKLSKKNK